MLTPVSVLGKGMPMIGFKLTVIRHPYPPPPHTGAGVWNPKAIYLLENIMSSREEKVCWIVHDKISLVYWAPKTEKVVRDSSVGKESACNARDPSSIPGSGRSPGEGIGYPLQYSWASLVAQLIKNPPALWETWLPSLDWEDPMEKGKATHSSILAWRIPWTV